MYLSSMRVIEKVALGHQTKRSMSLVNSFHERPELTVAFVEEADLSICFSFFVGHLRWLFPDHKSSTPM